MGKYYWIKIKTDFFCEDGPIDFLLSKPNGSDYVVLYIKLCLATANTQGRLCSTIGEMIIPYDAEKITRDMKYFSMDTVMVALELYKALGLIYEESDGILTIAHHNEMIGSCSEDEHSRLLHVERQKKYRERQKLKEISVTVTERDASQLPSYRDTEIRDIEIRDKDIYKDYCSKQSPEPSVISMTLNDNSEYPITQSQLEEWKNLYPSVDVMQELRNMRGWLISNPKRRKTKSGILRFINGWLSKEQDKPKRIEQKTNSFNNGVKSDIDFDALQKKLFIN